MPERDYTYRIERLLKWSDVESNEWHIKQTYIHIDIVVTEWGLGETKYRIDRR